MSKKIRILALVMVLCLLAGTALADKLSFSGVVVPTKTVTITAPIGGKLETLNVKAGDLVNTGDTIGVMSTNKVYATADGVVTAVYGKPGDNAESVTTLYGGCIYIESSPLYSISGSTGSAYNAPETKLIHSGEHVYLRGRSNKKHVGEGTVTMVSGTSYTVNVTSGEELFTVGESVEVFRDVAYTTASKLGRGNIARIDPLLVTGTGSIVCYAVKAGDTVKRGDLLMETADGTYDNLKVTGSEIKAGEELVICEITATEGTTLAQGDVIATAYSRESALAEVAVNECDLSAIQPGDTVNVELNWNQDNGVKYEGKVVSVSYLGEIGEEVTTYKAYVEFVPDAGTRYNMTVFVSPLSEDKKE